MILPALLHRLFVRNKIPIGVAGIITKGNKLLLTKRSFIIESGKWCLPGGKIEYGETAEAAIRREIKEETGLEVARIKFLFYHDEFVPRLRLHALVLVFKAEVKGKLKPNYEVAAARWFTHKESKHLIYAFTHGQIVDKYWRMGK